MALEATVHAQIEHLVGSLCRMDQRYAEVQAALLEARIVLERANQSVYVLCAEEASLRASRSAARYDIATKRAALENVQRAIKAARVQRILETFPPELLRNIFMDVATCAEQPWPEGAACDQVQTRAPFCLAAVNRKWRGIALDTTRIWTYVVVPVFKDRLGLASLVYVDLMLSRSHNQPLSLVISWKQCEWESSKYYGFIISSLGAHAERWQRLLINLPAQPPEDLWRVFRLPMPILEDLYFIRGSVEPHLPSTVSTYFPFNPRLRLLFNDAVFTVPRQRMNDLVDITFDIGVSVEPDAVLTFLRMSPFVKRLRFDFYGSAQPAPAPSGPTAQIVLPHLVFLYLSGAFQRFVRHMACLRMPRLEHLAVIDLNCIAVLSAAGSDIVGKVTSLTIGRLAASYLRFGFDLQHLRKLEKLKHIIFQHATFVGADIPETFATREAVGLPHLESVLFEEPNLDDKQAAHLADLMQALLTASHRADTIKFSLVAKEEEVPAWLLRQYAVLKAEGSHSPDKI